VGATSAGRPDSPTTKHGLPADIALSEAAASHVAAARRLLAKGSTCESSTCAALQPTGSSLRQSGSDCLAQRLDRWPTMLRGQAVRRASTGDAHERVVPLVLGAAGGPCRRLVCEAFSCIRRSSDGLPPPELRISTGRQPAEARAWPALVCLGREGLCNACCCHCPRAAAFAHESSRRRQANLHDGCRAACAQAALQACAAHQSALTMSAARFAPQALLLRRGCRVRGHLRQRLRPDLG